MNVLLISPFAKPDVGGVESHLEKLTTYLCDKKAAEVTLVTYMPLISNEKPPRHEKRGRLEVVRMPWFGKGWFRKLEAYFPANLFYLFPGLFVRSVAVVLTRSRPYDVIHAHGFIAGMIAKIIRRIHGTRAVISTHAIYALQKGSLKGNLFKWLLSGYDHVLAVGEPSMEEIIRLGIPAGKVSVHRNWVDIQAFRPLPRAEAKAALGIADKEFVVLFTGRMIGIKGELILLEAARRTKRKITFVFAGSGPEAHQIEAEAKNNERVVYLGRISDDQMKLAYNAADLFASPVLYDEGFATVYLEALASGTPVLTARRGCLPYFLSEPVVDFLDEVTAESTLRAIEKHFDDRTLLIDQRAECRAFAERNFSDKNAETIYGSYLQC